MMDNSLNVRQSMDADMEKLKNNLLRLANLADDALRKAVWALQKQDVSLAKEVLDNDDELDNLTARIDEDTLNFTARYQPMAKDLRTISTIQHMAVDLERIGDHGTGIAKFALRLAGQSLIKPLIDIPRMQKITSEMLDGVLKAFMHGDVEAAEKVCRLDDDIDDLEKQIFNEMLLLMMENPRIIEQATALFSIARALERSADHVTNLAERVIYMETGKVVKASHFRRPKETGPEGHS